MVPFKVINSGSIRFVNILQESYMNMEHLMLFLGNSPEQIYIYTVITIIQIMALWSVIVHTMINTDIYISRIKVGCVILRCTDMYLYLITPTFRVHLDIGLCKFTPIYMQSVFCPQYGYCQQMAKHTITPQLSQ